MTYLSATKITVVLFIFFRLSSALSENISTQIASLVTGENESIFHGEINQLRCIQFPQTKCSSFQKTGSTYRTGYTMAKEKILHFSMYVRKPWKLKYWLLHDKMIL